MPHSLMLECYPTNRSAVERVTPKALHGLFFQLVAAVDPQLAAQLHDQPRKAFTTSPLRPVSGRHGDTANGLYSVRFTALDDGVFQALNRYFLERLSTRLQMQLGPTEIVVTRLLASRQNGDIWSNYQTYEQLWEEASAEDCRLALQFLTPTAFKTGDDVLPLPVPDLVFGSYLQRWNAFAPVHFPPDELLAAVQRSMVISRHEIATSKLGYALGFTGQVTFQLRQELPPAMVKQLNALADFSYYCGTGYKTTMGCGWTRRLPPHAG